MRDLFSKRHEDHIKTGAIIVSCSECEHFWSIMRKKEKRKKGDKPLPTWGELKEAYGVIK